MISNGLFYLLFCAVFTFKLNIVTYAQNVENAEAIAPSGIDLFYLCKRDRNVRWLRIYKLDNGKCNTQYSKEGYLQIIGSATYYASCEGILQSVKKNLEEGGFICNPSPKYSVIEL